MADNVTEFPLNDLLPEEPEQTLKRALTERQFKYVAVLGETDQGELYARFSSPSGAEAVYLIEQVKQAILTYEEH